MRLGFAAPLVAARIADDARRPAGAGDGVIVDAVQVAVQPDVGERQQVVVGVAEARRAAARATIR